MESLNMESLEEALAQSDWHAVRHLVRNESESQELSSHDSRLGKFLERLVEEPDMPLDIVEYCASELTAALVVRLETLVRNIWRRVLVDREEIAYHAFRGPWRHEKLVAHKEYEQELLNIQTPHDLASNRIFDTAWTKTKLLFQYANGGQSNAPLREPLINYIVANEAAQPFLLLLAYRADPNVLVGTITNTTYNYANPLQIASEASSIFRGASRASAYYHRICFSQHSPKKEHQMILDAMNDMSFVPILCLVGHNLACKASSKLPLSLWCYKDMGCQDEDWFRGSTTTNNRREVPDDQHDDSAPIDDHHQTRGFTPLENFLYGLGLLNFDGTGTYDCGDRNVERALQDMLCVVSTAPQALETRHPKSRLWAFLIPMTFWNKYDHFRERRESQTMLLTLSFRLLRANPAVLLRCYDGSYRGEYNRLHRELAQVEREMQLLQEKRARLKQKLSRLEPLLEPCSTLDNVA